MLKGILETEGLRLVRLDSGFGRERICLAANPCRSLSHFRAAVSRRAFLAALAIDLLDQFFLMRGPQCAKPVKNCRTTALKPKNPAQVIGNEPTQPRQVLCGPGPIRRASLTTCSYLPRVMIILPAADRRDQHMTWSRAVPSASGNAPFG